MKKFLKYLILFLFPLLAVIVFFEVYLRQIDTSYTEKERGIIENAQKIAVLILGNSRATLGIDSNEFEAYAYNLGNVAQPFYYDKRIALKYLDRLTNLKFVFITVDASSLNYSRMESRAVWSYYGNGVEYKDELSFTDKHFYLKGYSPSIALKLLKNDWSGKFKTIKALDLDADYRLDTPITKGFFTYKNTREEGFSEEHIFNRANKGLDEGVSAEKKEITEDLEGFIKILQARKIVPILLTMPCYEGYVKALHPNTMKRAQSDFESISRKYNIEYWNYLNLPMERTNFHDCDHLNSKGAVKFAKVLDRRLNEKVEERRKRQDERR